LYLARPAGSTRPTLVLSDDGLTEYPVTTDLIPLQLAGDGQLPHAADGNAEHVGNLSDVH
jgi:hypothetical protein